MWAFISNDGVVLEITDIDPAGRFHPSLEWAYVGETPIGVGWTDNGDGTFSAPPPPPSVPDHWQVTKLTVVDRLADAGLLRAAMTAIKADDPAASMTDEEVALRERWRAASTIRSDDPQVRAVLVSAGADPDEILAR